MNPIEFWLSIPTFWQVVVGMLLALLLWWWLKRWWNAYNARNDAIAMLVKQSIPPEKVKDVVYGRQQSKYAHSVNTREIKEFVDLVMDLSPRDRTALKITVSPEFQEQVTQAVSIELQAIIKKLEIIRDHELTEFKAKADGTLMQGLLDELIEKSDWLEGKASRLCLSPERLRVAEQATAANIVAEYMGKLTGGEVGSTPATLISPAPDVATILMPKAVLDNRLPGLAAGDVEEEGWSGFYISPDGYRESKRVTKPPTNGNGRGHPNGNGRGEP